MGCAGSKSAHRHEHAGRYTDPDAMWAALRRGSVRRLRRTYILELADKEGQTRRSSGIAIYDLCRNVVLVGLLLYSSGDRDR